MKFDIDSLIKGKFQLFTGLRAQEEDQKIYDTLYDACFDGMLAFLEENLDKKELSELTKSLEMIDKNVSKDEMQKAEEGIGVMQKALGTILGGQKRLLAKLEMLLDTMLYTLIKQKKT